MPDPRPMNGNGRPPVMTLTIIFDPATQQLKMEGPTENRILCYGMLGMAREILTGLGLKSHQQTPASGIVPIHGRLA